MSLAKDKLQHLAGGAALALWAVAVVWVDQQFGLKWAVPLVTTSIGWGFEGLQKYRKEGAAEWRDAVATSAPGYAAGLVLHFTGWTLA